MGRSITPKYAAKLYESGVHSTEFCWHCRIYGKPTVANLEKYIMAYIRSQYAGGCNEHLAKHFGRIMVPNSAYIRRNVRNGDDCGWDNNGGYALKHEWL